MAILLEDLLPGVKYNGLNSKVAIDFSSASSLALPSGFSGTSGSLTTPVIAGGLTASGSGANDFSGSTGTFKTSTGAVTIGNGAISVTGAVTMAANIGIATLAGTGAFDLSNATGIFKTSTGVNTFGGSSNTFTNAITPTGGVAAAGGFASSKVFHSGGVGLVATTGLTQTQIVTTDTYYCEVFIPANATITGVSVLNGNTTNGAVNLTVGLANSSGVIVASSATTNAQGAANAYQQIPFSTPYAAVGPAKYFIAVQGSTTTGYLATHTLGNFGAQLKTSETYGTFVTTGSYSTTTFTTATGPAADLY